MILDHFQKTHLDKLFNMGFSRHPAFDHLVVMTYNSRGIPWRAWIISWQPHGYYVGTTRLDTNQSAEAFLTNEDFPGFLEEEIMQTDPDDVSSGSAG